MKCKSICAFRILEMITDISKDQIYNNHYKEQEHPLLLFAFYKVLPEK